MKRRRSSTDAYSSLLRRRSSITRSAADLRGPRHRRMAASAILAQSASERGRRRPPRARAFTLRRAITAILSRFRADTRLGNSPPNKKRLPPPLPPAPAAIARGPGVRVLSVGEAAARLGLSRDTLEAMIAAGKVLALQTGFTKMVPTNEVARLSGGGLQR